MKEGTIGHSILVILVCVFCFFTVTPALCWCIVWLVNLVFNLHLHFSYGQYVALGLIIGLARLLFFRK